MNRQQRREQMREERREALKIPLHKRQKMMADAEARARLLTQLVQNGITPEDLKKNYDIGYSDGYRSAGEEIIKSCYAAVCATLEELHGFKRKRCLEILNAVDKRILYTLNSQEAIDEVYDRIGLKLNFKDPFYRVQEVEG